MKLNWKLRSLCILSGGLAGLAFSSLYLGWLMWFALIPFFYVLYSHELKAGFGFKCGFWFGISFYLVLIHWLLYLHPLTWLGFSVVESLIILGGGWIAISILEGFGIWLFGLALGYFKPSGWQRILIPAIFWLIMEWLQGFGELSLPWGRLVVSQFQYTPLLQISAVTGSMFISALIVAFNAAVACCLVDWVKFSKYVQTKNILSLMAVTLIVFFIFISGLNSLKNFHTDNQRTIPVTLVQGNFSQSEKWSGGSLGIMLNTYLNLTQNSSNTQPKLVIWPESAVPVFLKYYWPVKNELVKLAVVYNLYLLTGIFDAPSPTSNTYYNGATVIDNKGKILGWYYKRHLVPFGEYLPFRGVLDFLFGKLSWMNAIKHDIEPGTDASPFVLPFGNVGTLICFESVYPDVARENVLAGAEMLAIITNDGWYKDSIAAYQHNAQAVLRAIENGRDIVRAANTGITSIIDYQGRILKQTELLKREYITGNVTFRSDMTFYTKYGDWLVYLGILLILPLFLYNRKGR